MAGPRLLFVSTVYPTPWEPHKGPANRSIVESMRELGCEVRVISPVPWTRRMAPRSAVTPVECYPIFWYPPRILRSHYHTTMQWSIGATMNAVAKAFRPDAVLAAWVDPDGTVALRHARSLGIRGGVVAMGSDLMLSTDAGRRRIIAATIQAADHVFAVGSVLKRKAIELGARPERVSNFVAGVDLKRFVPGDRARARALVGLPPTGPVLLWIGSMVAVKATERLLQAAARMTSAFPDLTVALIGTGPRRAALEQFVAATPALTGRVRFAGPVGHEALPTWYQAATAFVLPSRSEGVPNVLLESMACGLPFIASDVGSICDLLPFGSSAVVPEGDVGALAHAIADLLHGGPVALAPRQFDRLDGARHLLQHLGLRAA